MDDNGFDGFDEDAKLSDVEPGAYELEEVIFTHTALRDEHITQVGPRLWADSDLVLWVELGDDPKGIRCAQSGRNFVGGYWKRMADGQLLFLCYFN